jgi:hypothetical protein
MASYGVLEEHTILDPDFSILAFAFCWACGLSWNEAWANVKSLLLDIPMSLSWCGPLEVGLNRDTNVMYGMLYNGCGTSIVLLVHRDSINPTKKRVIFWIDHTVEL